jgi:hypothetical protein
LISGIDGGAGRQDVVERPGRDRLAHGELHQPVQRRGEIVRRRSELPRVGDAVEGRQRDAQRDAVPGQDLLGGDLDRLGPQIDLRDPDGAADLPEGMTTGRELVDEHAVDEEQADLVRLDDRERDQRRTRQVELVEVTGLDCEHGPGVDQLALDPRDAGPEGARLQRREEVPGLTVQGDDRDLARTGAHDMEMPCDEVGMALLVDAELLGRQLGADDRDDVDGQPAHRVEQCVPAGFEQALELAVAPEQAALVLCDPRRQAKNMSRHRHLHRLGLPQPLPRDAVCGRGGTTPLRQTRKNGSPPCLPAWPLRIMA